MLRKFIQKIIFIIILLTTATFAFSLSQRQVGELLERSSAKVSTYFGNQIITFGSGFLLSKKGYIGTNMHVVDMALAKNGRIMVEFLNHQGMYEAQVVNWDKYLDFAILKINATSYQNLRILDIGNSGKLKSLDSVYVAGFPVTGTFKAQKGEVNSFQKLFGKNYIDISVPIDKGNSGGPIVDNDGDLVGVSVAFLTTARSMNLAIPVNEIKELIERTIGGGHKYIIWDGKEKENNNDKYRANLIAQGLLVEGSLSDNDEVDWYEIAGQEGYNPRISIAHAKGNNFNFEVYSDSALVCKAGGLTEIDGTQCSVPGRCFIKINRVTGSGSYSLQISSQQKVGSDDGREQEPNNSKAIATMTKSMNLIGSLDDADTVDWFELMGQEGATSTFILSHSTKSDYNFDIYSEDAPACYAIGTSVPDKTICAVKGKCFVKIWRVSGEGSYVIRIENSSNNPKGK